MNELVQLTACEAVESLRKSEVCSSELIDAALTRMDDTDGAVNAIPTRCAERARVNAHRLQESMPANPPPWYLYGLPIVVKDLSDVEGVRTTYGSTIFADHIPTTSDIMVQTLERNGAIVLAKSATPEFGAGANTFNEVFGRTCNPWNTRMTPGGSSGGTAVALATGQIWLGTGSDLGGSLRIPASYCSIVGLRPTPGIVSAGPRPLPFDNLSVHGPMARNVKDLALMLDALSNPSRRDPLSRPKPSTSYTDALHMPTIPKRIAYSPDLGIVPVDPEVATISEKAAHDFEALGATVEEACPKLDDAEFIFQTLRAVQFAATKSDLLQNHRHQLKPEIIWNIEKGLSLSGQEMAEAESKRGKLFKNVTDFFDVYDLLICPTVAVPPFDGATRYVSAIGDHKFDNYVSWLALSFAITLTSCPAISVPCGFNRDGLPIGLQLVAAPGSDARLLEAAFAFEQFHDFKHMVPINPRPGNTNREPAP